MNQATRKRLLKFIRSTRKGLTLGLSAATVLGVAVYYIGTRIARKIKSAIASSSALSRQSEKAVNTEPAVARIPIHTTRKMPEAPSTSLPGAEKREAGIWRCPEVTSEVHLVGSIEGHTYHRPSCLWAKNIRDENRICFASIQIAQEHGYNPCNTCKPS